MEYIGKIFRPPSEAYSIILQTTVGCAHNTCTFCNMYKDDNFYIKDRETIFNDLNEAYLNYPKMQKFFLADGDALYMDTDLIVDILDYIYGNFKYAKQVSSYATVQDILHKSDEELKKINEKGLQLLYIGLESGNDEILRDIKKGVTSKHFIKACRKAHNTGFKISLTMISGLGGVEKSHQHAIDTAKVISEIKPDYASFLTLIVENGTEIYNEIMSGKITLLTPEESLYEILTFLENVDAEGCVFRANHASNYAPVGGTLNKDIHSLIEQIKIALKNKNFRPEFLRST